MCGATCCRWWKCAQDVLLMCSLLGWAQPLGCPDKPRYFRIERNVIIHVQLPKPHGAFLLSAFFSCVKQSFVSVIQASSATWRRTKIFRSHFCNPKDTPSFDWPFDCRKILCAIGDASKKMACTSVSLMIDRLLSCASFRMMMVMNPSFSRTDIGKQQINNVAGRSVLLM